VPPASPAKTTTTAPKSAAPAVPTSQSISKPRDESASTKPVAKEERKAIPVKSVEEITPKVENKKSYTVAKGDTPVSIAKKFKITSTQLLAANKIEDAHKLKIGQKLVIPPPKEKMSPKETKKPKKSE
jgi:LysM repeat protein